MKLFLGIGISLSTLRKNKLRAVLTITGTSVGISMIIGILAVGNGLREFVLGEMQRAGELDVVKVRLGDWVEQETWDAKATPLTMEDLAEQAVEDVIEAVEGLDEERAAALIMTARAPWFADEGNA